MTDRYLIDKSALARYPKHQTVKDTLRPLHLRGLLAVCATVQMEVLYSARNGAEAERLSDWMRGFDHLPMPDEVWDRALEVQRLAISKGFHRALSMADLLIAATGERHEATVLHYDGDYDMIAELTGQPTRWAAQPGNGD